MNYRGIQATTDMLDCAKRIFGTNRRLTIQVQEAVPLHKADRSNPHGGDAWAAVVDDSEGNLIVIYHKDAEMAVTMLDAALKAGLALKLAAGYTIAA